MPFVGDKVLVKRWNSEAKCSTPVEMTVTRIGYDRDWNSEDERLQVVVELADEHGETTVATAFDFY